MVCWHDDVGRDQVGADAEVADGVAERGAGPGGVGGDLERFHAGDVAFVSVAERAGVDSCRLWMRAGGGAALLLLLRRPSFGVDRHRPTTFAVGTRDLDNDARIP